ncbi:dienelactone hydrolase [Rhizoctonia solani AG-1 IA]|uniref:Dienelactone hydrolase n=1 Tax=Thanatephorus cucumeris (strain AG1-IA) TaxID=983506 RepID=L8WYE6_THACA|nr:dienelactone hydrolase [Rhizoctonia solani AG-1 IA]
MLITKTHHDIKASNGTIRIFVISPVIQVYPEAKFPGVVVFRYCLFTLHMHSFYLFTQRDLSSHGSRRTICGADRKSGLCSCPSRTIPKVCSISTPHPREVFNWVYRYRSWEQAQSRLIVQQKDEIEKEVAAYDEDATLSVDLLVSLPNCTGRVAATGMCLGGHLAFRVCAFHLHPSKIVSLSAQIPNQAAFDPRVLASVCFFATDVHSRTLGKGKNDDSLARVERGDLSDGRTELVMIFGKQDTHVPRAGRDLIRKTLEDSNVIFSVSR